MAKFCTNCGKKTEEGEQYCAFCGQCLTNKPNLDNNPNSVKVDKTNDLAIIGLVVSIAVSAIIGIVLCAISIGQIKKTEERGKEIAIAGIIIGVLRIVLFIVWFIFVFFIAITDSSSDYEEYDFGSNNAIVEVIDY